MPTDEPAPRLLDAYDRGDLAADSGLTVLEGRSDGATVLVAGATDATRLPELLGELATLRDSVLERSAAFGALLAPGVEYVFRPRSDEGLDFEQTVPALPDTGGDVDATPRAFESALELRLCFHRLYNLQVPSESMGAAARKEKFARLVRAIQDRADGADPDAPFGRAVASTFGAFDLEATGSDALTEFVHHAAEIDSIQRYSTRREIADFLVDLADVGPGDTVLDPAAGVGSILRRAAEQGAEAVGVEVDEDAATIARFFNDLVDADVTIERRDFLADEDLPVGSRETDAVVLEPPSTRNPEDDRVGSLVTREGEHIEEQIVRRAAAHLTEGTTLTALVPYGMFVRPDAAAREFREHLRGNYRIETLLEVVNPSYYPYPGVRTGVLQLGPEVPEADYEVRVDRLVAASDSERFEAAGGKDVETLLDETLAAIRDGSIETVSVSAFGDVLDPSDALRCRELRAALQARFDGLVRLDEVATIERGQSIPQRDLADEGIPYLRIATRTGHESERKYVPEEDAGTVATETDLLVSVKGTVGELYVPEEPVVPRSEWAVLGFESADAARVYRAFFETSIGADVAAAFRESAIVPYPRYTPELSRTRLGSFLVPDFDADEVARIAAEVADLGPDAAQDELDAAFGLD